METYIPLKTAMVQIRSFDPCALCVKQVILSFEGEGTLDQHNLVDGFQQKGPDRASSFKKLLAHFNMLLEVFL